MEDFDFGINDIWAWNPLPMIWPVTPSCYQIDQTLKDMYETVMRSSWLPWYKPGLQLNAPSPLSNAVLTKVNRE